ncbi:MAG: hypothetical protein ACI9VR_004879, partial [Cognaticolwellia sp.]
MSVDLSDFETDVELRQMGVQDIDVLLVLGKLCFPNLEPWTRSNLENQLKVWKRSQLGLFVDGQLVGSCGQLMVHSGDYSDWSD